MNAGTPPARAITFPAALLRRAHCANLSTSLFGLAGRDDQEDVPGQRVLQVLDLARCAGHPVDLGGVKLRAPLPGETGVADRVGVLLDGVDHEAVGGQRVDVARGQLVVEHRLEEEVVGPSVGVTADRVDRRGEVRARDGVPVGGQPGVDVPQLADRDVLQVVGPVDVDAEPVEVHLDVGRPGIAGQRQASLPGELALAVLDVLDPCVAAIGGVDEADAAVELVVLREQRLEDRLSGHRA